MGRTTPRTLDRMAELLCAAPALSITDAIRQATRRPSDASRDHRLRRKFREQRLALITAAERRQNPTALQSDREATQMIDAISGMTIPLLTALAGATAGTACSQLLTRAQRKAARTPAVRIEFADEPRHENLGAVGFRHLCNEFALRISGMLRNGGTVSALGLRLDIYHYQSSKARPTHEIIGLPVADMLPPGEAVPWSRTITLNDVTVDHPKGYYMSGHTGIFRDDPNNQYYHYHVVFSWMNAYGEEACAIYGMEKIIEGQKFEGNRMVFIRQSATYDPRKQFPREWRDEINARELKLKQLMTTGNFGVQGFGVEALAMDQSSAIW